MKDNLQLIGQVVLIVLGPILLKHGITVGNDDADKILGSLAELAGILWKFFHWHLTPSATPATADAALGKAVTPSGSQSGFISSRVMFLIGSLCMIAAAALIFLSSGCASVQPGQDPLVVNVERAQTVAAPTFDMVLTVDNAQRPFWQEKAPAFHDFCEWLRQPQAVTLSDGTATNVQRAIAMQLNLDNVKLAYKSGRASSNTLVTAMTTLQSAAQQASAWLTITTNQP